VLQIADCCDVVALGNVRVNAASRVPQSSLTQLPSLAEDMAMPAPAGSEAFVAYNKVDGQVPTLVGNWVEVPHPNHSLDTNDSPRPTQASCTTPNPPRVQTVCPPSGQQEQSLDPCLMHH
jgi:hypothetical protein